MKILHLLFFAPLLWLIACAPAPRPAASTAPAATADSLPAPTLTPTATPVPTETPDPGYYTAPDGTFTLIPPESWEPHELGMQYPALVGPQLGSSAANLLFVQEEAAFPVESYAAAVQDQLVAALPEIEPIREDFLITDDGHAYYRWEIANTQNNREIRQVLYFYGPGDWKLVITYTRPLNAGEENDRLVDAAMQTVRYDR